MVDCMLDKMKNLDDLNFISNICHGTVWKEKVKKLPADAVIVPYLLYQDDHDVTCTSSSKSVCNKVSACYISFPLLDDDEKSMLENIFMSCLTKSSDLIHGQGANFNPPAHLLNELESEGLNVGSDELPSKIYFVMAALIADNLALNTMLGFTRSFSANHCCRLCSVHKDVMHTQTTKDSSIIRNEMNYWHNLLMNDVSATGIREPVPFMNIGSFNVYDNKSVDFMHDFLEGICHSELCSVLNNFIFEKKYFDLKTLNIRKRSFPYHHADLGNLSTTISDMHLKNKKLKMSASEMLNFTHYLPLLIHDLVPLDDEVWKFLILFLNLTDFCLLPSYDEASLQKFSSLITEHHSQYINLFGHLTPKHHNVVHYPTVIRMLDQLNN